VARTGTCNACSTSWIIGERPVLKIRHFRLPVRRRYTTATPFAARWTSQWAKDKGLQLGAKIDTPTATGENTNEMTALHLAAATGHVEAIKVLVQLGADIEANTAVAGDGGGGDTPLHLAVNNGRMESIQMLVQLGANKEAKTAPGGTPMHVAALTGHVEVIKLLAQLGVQIDEQTHQGETPHRLTVRWGKPQAARLFGELERITRARTAAATSERAQQAATQADRTSASVEAVASQADACAACGSSSGASDAPLKRCSRCQSVKYCSALCQRTHWPAHKASCAAAAASGSGGGASTAHVGAWSCGHTGRDAARCGAGRVDVAEVRRLVAIMGVDVDERDANGATPLHVATGNGHVDVMRALMQLGAEKETKGPGAWTALHFAAAKGHVEAIKVLEQAGAAKEALVVQRGANKEATQADGRNDATALGARQSTGTWRRSRSWCSLARTRRRRVLRDGRRYSGRHSVVTLRRSSCWRRWVRADGCKGCGWIHSSRAQHHEPSPSGGAGVRELKRTARTRKAAVTSERAKQAAEQNTAEASAAAERMAAHLIEEEEREQAAKAQIKVRGGPPLAHVRGERRCLCRISERPTLPAHCVVCSRGWGAAEGQAAEGQGQGHGRWWRSGRRAIQQGGGCGEQQRPARRARRVGRAAPQHATIRRRCPP
jgi:ankyrin repeat protein